MRLLRTSLLGVFAIAFMAVESIQAASLFSETFDTDVTSTGDFLSNYGPPWFIPQTDGNNVRVVGGQAQIEEIVGVNSFTRLVVPGFDPNVYPVLTVEADISADVSNGQFQAGMDLGEVLIGFHPGFAGAGIEGAFRVNNLWGGGDVGDTGMGFVPDNVVMHHWKIVWTQNTGEFDITITDGANPANAFNFLWSDPSAAGAAGRPVGFFRAGVDDKLSTEGLGLYDNFVVTPEPSSLLLAGLAMLPLLHRRRVRA